MPQWGLQKGRVPLFAILALAAATRHQLKVIVAN